MMTRKMALLLAASSTRIHQKRTIINAATDILNHKSDEYPVFSALIDELVGDGLMNRENLEGYTRTMRGTVMLKRGVRELELFVSRIQGLRASID